MSMPRVGSKHSIVRTPPATQRAIVTFCWLPPDRRRTSPPARASICSARDRAVDRRRSPAEVDQAPACASGAANGSAMFSRTERCISSASARSAADVHDAGADRVGRDAGTSTGEPSTSSSPAARAIRAGEDVEQLVLALALERDDARAPRPDTGRTRRPAACVPRSRPRAREPRRGVSRPRPTRPRARRRPACPRRPGPASARRSGPPSPRSRRRRRP